MLKRITSIVVSVILVFILCNSAIYASSRDVNPSRDVLEKKIEEIALKRGIPSVILKSIARVESIYQQFRPDGKVFRGSSGEIGLMQIYNKYGYYDSNRLKYDIDYNIEISAEILLQKWANYGQIGNMDPNILENWYFALWAYNGWSSVNNPNTGKKKNTYQELIYMVAEEDYGQKITSIDASLLPNTGKPNKNIYVPAPEAIHFGDIPTYLEGDFVIVDSRNPLILRSSPNGIAIDSLEDGEMLEVIEGPILKDSFLWYKVKTLDDDLEGWTVCNWINKTGSKYPFEDIGGLWAKDYIIELYEKGIINGQGNGNFNPNNNINRQEMCVLLTKALNLEGEDYVLLYDDINTISDWAIDSVKAVSKAGIMKDNNEENLFNPYDILTREEIAVVIANILNNYLIEDEKLQEENLEDLTGEENNEGNSELPNGNTTEAPEDEAENKVNRSTYSRPKSIEEMMYEYIGFKDAYAISWWAKESVKLAKEEGILEGSDDILNPKEYVNRAEISKILVKILDKLDQQESTN